MSEKTFKKIQSDFDRFGIKTKSRLKVLKQEVNQVPIKSPKAVKPVSNTQPLPYGLMSRSSQFEPSNGLDSLSRTYRHRVGRLNDWHSTYGQGMYE